MINQISQWSFQHPSLAALIACIALSEIYYLLFNILQIINYVLTRFQWWMIAARLRDKNGNITRENIDSFEKLVNKIEKMTSRRKTKKATAKLKAKLLAMHTHCKVRHYSREAKRYKEYLRQITLWLAWKEYAKERLDDWQRGIMSDSVRCCFDAPDLKHSRDTIISGTGYGWLNVVNPNGLFSINIS